MIFSTDIMKSRLSVFCEVVRTLASAQDAKVMKLDKEEAKNSPRETWDLKRVSLGQIAICVFNFVFVCVHTHVCVSNIERPVILTGC